MITRFEISLRQARDAEIAIFNSSTLMNGLVQTASNVWEYDPDLDIEFEEDREQYNDFVDEVRLVLDLAHIDEYEVTEILDYK